MSSDTLKTGLAVVVVLLMVAAVYLLVVRNFRECRGAGFTRTYCTSTHFIR